MTFCHQVAEGNFNGESGICNGESDMKKVKVMREQKGSTRWPIRLRAVPTVTHSLACIPPSTKMLGVWCDQDGCFQLSGEWDEKKTSHFENTNETWGKDQVPIGDVGFECSRRNCVLVKKFHRGGLE